jgi:hypothetical protein
MEVAMPETQTEGREPAASYDPAAPRPVLAGGPGPLHRQPLIRLLLVNWLIGAGVALVLVTVVLITDTARLRSLMFASSDPWVPMLLLFFGFFVTMCSVAMGTAIMMLPGDDDDGPGGGTRAVVTPAPEPVPIRVAARPLGRRGARDGSRRFD